MLNRLAHPDNETGAKSPRMCVFTALIGQYERLNEQPTAARSAIPFICLTDYPDLKSRSWEIRHVSPLFAMDPIRSQRTIKLLPNAYLPDFDYSLYIDNSVILTKPPELVFERHFPASGLCLPEHSYRDSTLDEFLEVLRLGLDDPSRVCEQLDHYTTNCPEVLKEKAYWAAIILRNHGNPKVKAMLEVWAAHIYRYSRRDQLSINAALRHAGFIPDVMKIDNHVSWFHSWPHTEGRKGEKRVFKTGTSAMSAVARTRPLEQTTAQLRQYQEALKASDTWRVAAVLDRYARRFPNIARFGLGALKLGYWTATFQLHRRLLEWFRERRRRISLTDADQPTSSGEILGSAGRPKCRIYIDPADERGRQLVLHNGDFNPPCLKIWKILVADEPWTHIIDVGANYGEMLVNVEVPHDAKVIAVEPNPRVLPYLEQTLAEAGIGAEIVKCVVTDQVGSAQFLIDNYWSGTSRIAGPEDPTHEGPSETVTVPSTTLSELLGGSDAQPDIRALVKIDVEGQEANVLRGVMEMLENRRIHFVALAEIFHLSTDDLAWILEHFDVQIYDLGTERLRRVVPGTLDHLATLLADGRFHAQDAVLSPKGARNGGTVL